MSRIGCRLVELAPGSAQPPAGPPGPAVRGKPPGRPPGNRAVSACWESGTSC